MYFRARWKSFSKSFYYFNNFHLPRVGTGTHLSSGFRIWRNKENFFSVTTVYVESPIFTKEDENKYKFVSEEVDEFDEDQDEALRQSK